MAETPLDMRRIPLPVDGCLADIARALGESNTLIVQATPGSGKTTRVPPALLEAIPGASMVIVLEPRRLAARLAAQRVAWEMGEPCGKTVGYHIRFEQEFGAATRVLFMTEGMLLRYLIADPRLRKAGAVILDEFHERHMHTDVALATIRRLQATTRPDLKLVVMSATLDTVRLAENLGKPAVVSTAAENHPLTVIHEGSATQSESVEVFASRVNDRVAGAIVSAREALAKKGVAPGHALVFLAGAPEIDRCAEYLTRRAEFSGQMICKLHGSLQPQEQRRAFEETPQKKVILATNIAESSLTIEGVNMVVDAGLAKVPSFSGWAGLPTLKLQRVSQASCAQRAGRAARRGPGVVVRLFSEADFRGRPAFDVPEILRLDLTQTLLEVACVVDTGAGVTQSPEFPREYALAPHIFPREYDSAQGAFPGESAMDAVRGLPWLDPPDPARFASSTNLLRALGALDELGHATETGREMSRFPLHPRLARIVIEGKARGDLPAAITFAARASEDAQGAKSTGYGFSQTLRQIARIAGVPDTGPVEIPSSGAALAKFTPVILSGYADRVARLEASPNATAAPSPMSGTYRLVDGRSLVLKKGETAPPEWLCLLDADASPTDPSRIIPRDWIPLSMTPDFAALRAVDSLWREGPEVDWDTGATGTGGRVRGFHRIRFGALVLKETPAPVDPQLAEARLREELHKSWPRPFEDDADLKRWQERLLVYSDAMKEEVLLDLSGPDFEFLMDAIVEGKSSFSEITTRRIADYIEDLLGYSDARKVADACPESIKLASGRTATVHYRAGQPPWVEGKIQEFFGTKSLPVLVNGRVGMVVHLLAPNNRPVQVTSDLAGFWQNHYPTLRRELSRDYPRHFWPEDPLTAEARVFLRPRTL